MAMNSVLTNTAASSAQRFLTQAGARAESSISKLSSGSRIVKASDDAASLAISNKLRADIATLNQASRNASQGSSLLQVAGGGLAQIGDLLTRMKTLSTQVVNGTLSSSERQFAQQEFSQLITQVGETASQTQVNGIAMLNGGSKTLGNVDDVANMGTPADVSAAVGGVDATATTYFDASGGFANVVANIKGSVEGVVKDVRVTDVTVETMKIELDIGNQTYVGYVNDAAAQNTNILFTSTTNDHNQFELINNNAAIGTAANTLETDIKDLFELDSATTSTSFSSGALLEDATPVDLIQANAGATFSSAITASGATKSGEYTLTARDNVASDGTESVVIRLQHSDGSVYEAVVEDENTATADDLFTTASTKTVKFSNGVEINFGEAELDAIAAGTNGSADIGRNNATAIKFKVSDGNATTLNFQVGVKSDDTIGITFDSMTTTALGIAGLNIETEASAQAASDAIDTAINRVNTATAQVGALQSRMEYVQSNLATVTENLEAANGIFKDVDMAKEMTEFTKQQTLMQAGVSMLSQANQVPQMLMRLIQ